MDTPEQVLERLDRDVDAMRRRGFGAEADRMGKVAEEFRTALAPLALVPEHDAMARSGKCRRWLRERHATWARSDGAGWDADGNRLYRLCVLPSRLGFALGVAEAERTLKVVA